MENAMIGFARRLARTSFGIGCAIGITLNVGLYEAYSLAASAPTSPPSAPLLQPGCPPDPSLPPNHQAFAATQCAVHSAIFADQTEPSAGYALTGFAGTPGTYAGVEYLGRAVTFDAVFTIPIDLKTDAPALHQAGWQVTMVAGSLTGPAGKVGISGFVFLMPGTIADTRPALIATSTVTQDELDFFASSTRLQAGIRVFNTANGRYTAITDLTGTPQLWGYDGDISTLYCGCGGAGTGGADPACIKAAQDRYNVCRHVAEAGLVIAAALITLEFNACLLACAAGTAATLILPISIFFAVGCMATCFVNAAVTLAGAIAIFAAALWGCNQLLLIDLRACGVDVMMTQ
jgi:hypothetical protein